MAQKKHLHVSANIEFKMQGKVMGYEILEKGVVVEKHEYPGGHKNLIVNVGKDFFCTASTGTSFFNPTLLSQCVNKLGRGSGSTPAAATDTALQAQIGNRTTSILPGDPNTGVRYDKTAGTIFARKTFDSEVETSNQNINEIGIFTDTDVLWARVVLPATVTVLDGQQLRVTYELQVTVSPIAPAVASPTVTGWVTAGESRLEGLFPATSAVYGDLANWFLGVWGTTGNRVADTVAITGGGNPVTTLLEPATGGLGPSVSAIELFSSSAKSTFNTFGDAYTDLSTRTRDVDYAVCLVGVGGGSAGTVSATLAAYTPGNFYRDVTFVMSPNFPGGIDLPDIKAIRARGLTHIFDNPVSKNNLQQLTLTYRVTISS